MRFDEFPTSRTRRTLTAGGRTLRALGLDGPLTGVLAIIVCFGILVVYSASGQNLKMVEHHLGNIAIAVAAMHERAKPVEPNSWIAAVEGFVTENTQAFRAHHDLFANHHVDLLDRKSLAAFHRLRPLLAARGAQGLIRRGHGDLHLGNVAILDGDPVAFDALEFDPARLEAYLAREVPGFAGPLQVSQFKGGQSNPTYLLETPSRKYVLRRKPPGVRILLSSPVIASTSPSVTAMRARLAILRTVFVPVIQSIGFPVTGVRCWPYRLPAGSAASSRGSSAPDHARPHRRHPSVRARSFPRSPMPPAWCHRGGKKRWEASPWSCWRLAGDSLSPSEAAMPNAFAVLR